MYARSGVILGGHDNVMPVCFSDTTMSRPYIPAISPIPQNIPTIRTLIHELL